MEILGFLLLIVWLLVIPVCIGGIPAAFVDKQDRSPAFMCVAGYMLMWAVFQVICVPCVLLEEKHSGMFPYVVWGFGIVAVMLASVGCACLWKKKHKTERLLMVDKRKKGSGEKTAWGIFALLLMVQLAASIFLTYGDGDDAFYVAVSTITEASNTLYKIMPYSIGAVGLDVRHGLAPFPIWIAFLARVSGFKVAFVAHVAVGTFLIGMTYVIFYKIGEILYRERKEGLPIFLNFVALLVLFGDYSYKTPENFMIARSRQGKAALGNIIVPVVILLLLMILNQLQEKQKVQWMLWLLLCATVTAACLCSTLGTFLMCMMLGVAGLCAGIAYRNLRIVGYMAFCCVPAVIFAAMYFLLG